MKFEVRHRTTYRYSEPVVQSQHLLHLSPRVSDNQINVEHRVVVEPTPTLREDGTDAFGNVVTMLELERPHQFLEIDARSIIETLPLPTIDARTTTPWDRLDAILNAKPGAIDLDLIGYRCASPLTVPTLDIAAYAASSLLPGRPVLEAAQDLVHRIHRDFTFDATATDVSTPISRVFEQRRGVCQDFAHLMLACLRANRVPARYVSGYILTHPPPGQPKLQGSDASHAWVAIWSPEYGWYGLDPTNDIAAGEEHIVIAHGREYNDVSPINGVLLGGGRHTIEVGVDVVPIG